MWPLHVSYSGSQLAFAVGYLKKHHDVRLVSLMIGANDFFVCQATPQTMREPTELGGGDHVGGQHVKTIVSRSATRRTTAASWRSSTTTRSDYSSSADNAQSAFLNNAVDTAAKPFHVEVADGFGKLEAGAAHSGGNTCTAGLLTQLTGAAHRAASIRATPASRSWPRRSRR